VMISAWRSLRMSMMPVIIVFHYVCAVTSEVTVHVSDTGHLTSSVYQV